jgi:hypothetical protein
MKQYYLFAVDKSHYTENLCWWRPNNSGYTADLDFAGVYAQEQIDKDPHYYNNKETVPVLVEEVEEYVSRVVPKESSLLKKTRFA